MSGDWDFDTRTTGLRQQLADLQAIIGKQEEELHQRELEVIAVQLERDEYAKAAYAGLQSESKCQQERDEALALVARLRAALMMAQYALKPVIGMPPLVQAKIDDALSLAPPDALAQQQARMKALEDVAAAAPHVLQLLYAHNQGDDAMADALARLDALNNDVDMEALEVTPEEARAIVNWQNQCASDALTDALGKGGRTDE